MQMEGRLFIGRGGGAETLRLHPYNSSVLELKQSLFKQEGVHVPLDPGIACCIIVKYRV